MFGYEKKVFIYIFCLFELKKWGVNDENDLIILCNLVDKKFLYNIILVCKRNLFWSW
ncbi:MAG: hypothetical protein IJU86_01750 [Firmicutes bacterium]|nr:hypothetical protein [Bacillota bacterium]